MENQQAYVHAAQSSGYEKILAALLVVIITVAFFLIYRRRKSARRSILITGLCDTGKTLLYARLVHGKYVNTQTSIKENIGEYITKNDTLKIIDIPGHERLRDKFFEIYKAAARAIIYVIDSQTIQKDIRDVAEFLYNVLSDPVVSSNNPYILILCNKQDQPLVKSSTAIKTLLEKEINTLRLTKASQLESVDPKVQKNSVLGDEKTPFNFSSFRHLDFVEGYSGSTDDKYNIADLEKWLVKIA